MSSKPYFDEIATEWDTIRQGYFTEEVREAALKVADVKPGQLAGDMGAGSGFITEALLAADLGVIAVDQSEAMLKELKRRFPASETRLGDSASLPIDDGNLDHAFANMYLHHVEDPQTAIKEMARTLKPGGKLVITDMDEHEHEFLREEQHDRWLGFRREDIAAWFRAAGLEEVVVGDVGCNCCAESCCGTDKAEISVFIASGQKRPVEIV